MGGAKTVDPSKYIKKQDPTSQLAILMAMQQMQGQQQAQQAALAQTAAQMPPTRQEYDPSAQSRRAGELGMANLQRSRELEQMTSPQTAAMRQAQAAEAAKLVAPETAAQYMNEWAKRQGLIQSYETGLQDSTIGEAAKYDSALQAKRNFDQQQIALQQQILSQMQSPSGGIDPATSIAAQQAAEAQNLQAMTNWNEGMFGNLGGLSQSAADIAGQGMSGFQNIQQANAQNQQNYLQAMLQGQAANQAAKNALTGAYIQAGSNVLSSAAGIGAKSLAGAGGGSIAGYGGQQYVPKTSSTGGQFYAPVSGTI